MERALIYELKKIAEIGNRIYPMNIPEGTDRPCLAYNLIGSSEDKDLNGFTGYTESSYMFSVLAPTYKQMVDIRRKVIELVKGFLRRTIGEQNIYIQDVLIDDPQETYEINLMLFRGIIDFTIYYKE